MAADTQVCVAVFLAVNCPLVLVRLVSVERVAFKMDFAGVPVFVGSFRHSNGNLALIAGSLASRLLAVCYVA